MAFIKYRNEYEIGDRVKTKIMHESLEGYFEIGTEVTVTDVNNIRGYTIEDDEGNKIIEIGWVI